MRASRGEIKIEEILKEGEFNFKMEYVFPDLKSPSGRPLRFDFVVFDDDGLIDFVLSSFFENSESAKSLSLSNVISGL
jgi:hypothetical protein